MPVIEAKFIEGVLTPEQKQQVIPKLTDALVSVMGEPIREHIFVLIEETGDGEWGIGGKPVRAEQVRALGDNRSKRRNRSSPRPRERRAVERRGRSVVRGRAGPQSAVDAVHRAVAVEIDADRSAGRGELEW